MTNPTPAELPAPPVGRLDTPKSMGAHTVFPVLGVAVPEFAKNRFVVLINESGPNMCHENRQMVHMG